MKGSSITGDNPIRCPEDDLLGREGVARAFVRQALAVDAAEGVVVGVLGPWGSGKTSFINLARAEFSKAGVPILDFNPWMFSGAQQLVERFFIELAAQLKVRSGLAEIGEILEAYGELVSGMGWLPVVGTWIERTRALAKSLSKRCQRGKESVSMQRERLESALTRHGKPIVVVLDDIDRLSAPEIRDVFKLVRLNAKFPNLIYIVAFDRERVEDALTEQGLQGRDYLEKIVQVVIDLPVASRHLLEKHLLLAVEAAVSPFENPGPFDKQAWPDVFAEIIRPFIRNMRDVRRYAVAIHCTVHVLNGQIGLVDTLGLEAVRVFLPNVFKKLHSAVEGLTTTSGDSSGRHSESPQLKEQIEGLIKAGAEHSEVVRAMINRLFPAAERHIGGSHFGAAWKSQWLKKRRVAHEEILRLYLEGVAGVGLEAFSCAEQAWVRMADRNAFESYLRSVDRERVEDVIGSLEVYEDEFTTGLAVPGSVVLLNLLGDLPDRPRGMFALDGHLTISRVVLRLLRTLTEPAKVEEAVHEILPELNSLSAKLELIVLVGHAENRGHKLVSATTAAELSRAWRDEVRAASADDLVMEGADLFRVLLHAKDESDPAEPAIVVYDRPDVTLAVLRGARREVVSQTMGSRAIRRSQRLRWDALIRLYGDAETLRERVEALGGMPETKADDVAELAMKYVSGGPPKSPDDEDE